MAFAVATKVNRGAVQEFTGGETTGSDYCIDTTDETPAELSKYDYYVLTSATGDDDLKFYMSPDGGTTWFQLAMVPLSTVDTTPVLVATGGEVYGISGSFRDIRVGNGTATLVTLMASKLKGA